MAHARDANGLTVPKTVDAVVIPLDGSELSLGAVPVGCALAGRMDAQIHLVSTVETVDEVPGREADLTAIPIPDREVHRHVVVDRDPAGEIHETVRRLAPAVVCMATHGRGRSAALVGSVATDVVGRGRDPVVMVGPFVDPEHKGQGVVACVDETLDAAVTLASIASGWAALVQEPLRVITVAEPVPPPVRAGAAIQRRFGVDGDLEAYLLAVIEQLGAEDIEVEAHPVYDPIGPAAGVNEHLEEHPAFLGVVMSRGVTGLARLVFGSVAGAIVFHSRSPVLVVPRPD
ncbi:MAG: hypothetical protein QOG87_2182 [Actinomycetota bacterium]